jgi:hypothetical protein
LFHQNLHPQSMKHAAQPPKKNIADSGAAVGEVG